MIMFNMKIKYVNENNVILGVGGRRKATEEFHKGWKNIKRELEMKVFKESKRVVIFKK